LLPLLVGTLRQGRTEEGRAPDFHRSRIETQKLPLLSRQAASPAPKTSQLLKLRLQQLSGLSDFGAWLLAKPP